MLTIRGTEVRQTLPELVAPGSTALVVIDMQNDLCNTEGAFAAAGADVSAYPPVVETIAGLVAAAHRSGVLVVWVRVTNTQVALFQSPAQLRFELRMKRTYGRIERPEFEFCVPGSWGHDFLAGLDHRHGDAVIDKRRSSAFAGTDLDMLLRSNGIESIVVTGCTTEGCVDSTIREAVSLDYYVTLARDAVASDDPALHEAALLVLTAYRCDHATAAEIIQAWTSPAGSQ